MLKPDGHGYLYAWQMATHSANKNFKKMQGVLHFHNMADKCQNCYHYDLGWANYHKNNFFIKISKKAWHRKF